MIEEIYEILTERSKKPLSKHTLYKLLYTIKGRYSKFGNNIGLSRKEGICNADKMPKFDISEKVLRNIINKFLAYGLLVDIGKGLNKTKQVCNVYKIGENFLDDFLASLKSYTNRNVNVSSLSERIIDWCTNTNYIDFINFYGDKYGISVNSRGKIYEKIYTNGGIITDFKEGKTYNLFDYIKEITGINTLDLVKELKII